MAFNSDFHCFSDNPLDRAQAERRDSVWLRQQLSAPSSMFIPFQGEKPLIALNQGENGENPGGDIGWLPLADERIRHVEKSSFHLLGNTSRGEARFACDIHHHNKDFDEEAAQFEGAGKFIDLRSVVMQGLVSPRNASILAQAKSLTGWHKSHQFCSTCGAASVPADGGLRRHCPSCETNHFPRTDPVVIMLIVHGNECLLGRGAHYNEGQYSTLAGFVDQGESIEEAVRREIKEETRIDVGDVTYHSSQPWPFPSSLMIGCHGQALSHDIEIDDHEIEHARWFSRREVSLMIEKNHPENLIIPPKFAIAHHLIRHFVDGD